MALLAEPLVVFLFTDVVIYFKIICFTGILYPLHVYNFISLQVKGSGYFYKLEIIKKNNLSYWQ
jgi:hypothetical protein